MSAGAGGRLLVGNLDCEAEFAAVAGKRRVAAGRRALETAAAAATLLRAFARDGDRLWLPVPVAPEHVARVPGLPRPALESGPLAALEGAGEVLAWGETEAVMKLRETGLRQTGPRGRSTPSAPIHELPWRLAPAAPAAAAKVNDRRFCLRLAADLGCALSGAREIDSIEGLERHLAAGGARSSGGAWVVKATFSAAGRRRVVHRGGPLDGTVHRRLEKLLERCGAVVFEPWMERTADFGCAAAVTPGGRIELSCHRQLVDRQGRFRGLELSVGGRGFDQPWLAAGERERLERVADDVARALAGAGYAGPFGVDAWRYRDADGGEAFHPLGEINARLTFGLVARALVDRLREPLGLDPRACVRLVFGRRGDATAGAAVELFRATEDGGREIRLEIAPAR